MKRSRFSEEQIIGVLCEHDAGAAVAELCRKHGMSSATFYAWKAKYGDMERVGREANRNPSFLSTTGISGFPKRREQREAGFSIVPTPPRPDRSGCRGVGRPWRLEGSGGAARGADPRGVPAPRPV